MQHPHRLAGQSRDRMQHDEAGPVGQKVGLGLCFCHKRQCAIATARDPGPVNQAARCCGTCSTVFNGERIRPLVDPQIIENGGTCSPVFVPYKERDSAQNLDRPNADVTQRPIVERERQGAGAQCAQRFLELFGATQADCQRSCRGQSARSVVASKIDARFMLMSIASFSPGRLTSCACNSAITGAPASRNVA